MDTEAEYHLGERQRSTTEESRSKSGFGNAQPEDNACFDCNICLDFAVEPVVTLCGHLYCWPCIYKWLRLESATPQQCPVCKAGLSPSTLVPLYGRGYANGSKVVDGGQDIPRRPSTTLTASASASMMAQQVQQHHQFDHHHPHRRRHHHGSYMVSSSATTTMLGGTAIAVLPWILGEEWMGSYDTYPYHLIGSGSDSPRLRRQEMQARRSLRRISVFLACCVALCLLVF